MMSDYLHGFAAARRQGRPYGITSVCSAHPTVLRAALRRARQTGRPVLIEATCNQVNHRGGYTGMTPKDFVERVGVLASEEGLDRSLLIFGGDHLGPNPWRHAPAEVALAEAEDMVRAYVAAGFGKLHLDASMACGGEAGPLDDRTIAGRAAALCRVAEETAAAIGSARPVYVLGTEVPVPGGADHALTAVEPTAAAAAVATISVHREVFERAGLAEAFARAIAFVVQPGVEFGSDNVIDYDPARAGQLAGVLEKFPALVFEAHSTDYQPGRALAALVRDGFPILKVGPGLTFAYREALYALDMIAGEIVPDYGGRPLARAMEALMTGAPEDWRGHYHGDATAVRLQRHYSYSDRIRYYWNRPPAVAAVAALLRALDGVRIPETLAHQYLPQLPARKVASIPIGDVLIAAVDEVLATYDRAVHRH